MILSITIPCRNECSYIKECIDAIFKCELPYDLKIKVNIVDGMSTDGTREIVSKLCSQYPNLYLLDNTAQLTPFAFNIGIKENYKDSDFFQIIGARHIVSPNYFIECLKILAENRYTWCVGGKVINQYTNYNSQIISEAMSNSFGMGIGNFRTLDKSGYTDTVTSPMYPKFVFEAIGFFDENLVRNQDDDFNYRITKAGGKIFFCAEIELLYYVRTNFNQLKKQFFQYGYWKVFVNKKHKAITTIRQIIPSLFVLFIVLAFTAYFYCSLLQIPIIVTLSLYLLLASIFSIKYISKPIYFFKSILTYPLIHISYGLGYLNGIFDFLIRNNLPSEKNKTLSR